MRPIRDIVMSDALGRHERFVSQAITRAEVRGILKFCRSQLHRITYVPLAKSLGMFSGGTELATILGEIMLEDYEANEPVLSSLVVKVTNGVPGKGYFDYAKRLFDYPKRGLSDVQFWREQMEALGWGALGAANIVIGALPLPVSLPPSQQEASKVITSSGSTLLMIEDEKKLGVDE